MTEFLVTVADAAEARLARQAGADRLACRGPTGAIVAAAQGAPVVAMAPDLATALARQAEGATMTAVALGGQPAGDFQGFATAGAAAAILHAGDGANPATLDAIAAAGFSAVFLDAGGGNARLLACLDIGALAAFVERAHKLGLACGLSGRLQAPDIPRLLVLRPDILGFRSALCLDDALDPHALALFRSLIPRGAESQAPPHVAGVDRVFVRDFTIETQIGAYAHEKHGPQRVRFNVEAEVRRRPRDDDDFQNLFSYDVITDAIRRFAQAGHVTLVETLAERIAETTLRDRRVLRVRVRVEKLDVIDGAVGVEIVRDRA